MAKIAVFDALTNENIITEIDDKIWEAQNASMVAAEQERIATKEAERAAAEAKLTQIGLSVADLKALGL
jgi:hypothetical protein